MLHLGPVTFLVVVILFSKLALAYRRDHRFLDGSHAPSLAFASLMGQYTAEGKYFGNIVRHGNSDGTVTEQIVLANQRCMPTVGFGTWQLGGNSSVIQTTIKQALDAGYRLIDTAYLYNTEDEIGEALAGAFADGKLKREDIFITTKVWPTYFSKAKVLQSIRDSLRKLKLQYLDLVLLHYPTGFKEGTDNYPTYPNGSIIPLSWKKDAYLETWKAMEDAVKLRLTRSIGVSNFNQAQMSLLLHQAKVKPVVNQVEAHPFLNQEKFRKFLLKNKVILQAYAPLRRADKALLGNPVLDGIAKRHRKSTAQVALRWQLDRSVALVVKSSNPGRMATNIDLFDFRLSRRESARVLALAQKPRIYSIPGIENHPDYPFEEE